MSEFEPVAARERLLTLDVLRGFALCGVMIGNLVLYSGRWAAVGGGATSGTLDEVAAWFVEIAVAGKAQTLLTFLFGLGFAVQLVRAQARGERPTALYLRRMIVLFALGAAHVTLLWWGDVTWTYAVAGFGMLAFARASNRARVVWGLILVLVPVVLMRTVEPVAGPLSDLFFDRRDFRDGTRRMLAALNAPDRDGLAWEHVRYAAIWVARILAWYFFWTLGRFLLGYVAGQRRWFERDGADHLPVFRRLALAGGAIAAVSTAVAVLERTGVTTLDRLGVPTNMALVVISEVGLLAQTAMYVGVVVLLMQRPGWRRILGVLAPPGRMPLTTYFSQSLICTFAFYGWGLGWAGLGPAGCLGFALAVYSVQVALAHLWLRYFRVGPLEWVWRTAVYMKPQPMR